MRANGKKQLSFFIENESPPVGTHPFNTNTEVYSFKPIRIKSSSTEAGPALLALRFIVLRLFRSRCSGNTSTLMNLKCPKRPWLRPRQMPDAFMDITSMISPFCNYKNLLDEFSKFCCKQLVCRSWRNLNEPWIAALPYRTDWVNYQLKPLLNKSVAVNYTDLRLISSYSDCQGAPMLEYLSGFRNY